MKLPPAAHVDIVAMHVFLSGVQAKMAVCTFCHPTPRPFVDTAVCRLFTITRADLVRPRAIVFLAHVAQIMRGFITRA